MYFKKKKKKNSLPGWGVIGKEYIKLVSKMIAASICGLNALGKDLLKEEKTNLSNMGVKRNDKGPLNN